MTQNTVEVRVLPYGMERGNEQADGWSGHGLNSREGLKLKPN